MFELKPNQVMSELYELVQLLVHGEDLVGDHVHVLLRRHRRVLFLIVDENEFLFYLNFRKDEATSRQTFVYFDLRTV